MTRLALILTTVVSLAGLISPVTANVHGRTITVWPHGKGIQDAINKAQYGDRIVVKRGTYPEQLTINKDGIYLDGCDGAILVPPQHPIKNTCTGLGGKTSADGLSGKETHAGICIQGHGVKLDTFKGEHKKVLHVQTYVKKVSVTGFDIRGFSGENIVIIGGEDCQIFKNTLTDAAKYGALTVGSKNSKITGNTVTAKDKIKFIAICMDDSTAPFVTHNTLSGYYIALCVQTSGANVNNNIVTNSCMGAFIDPNIKGAKVTSNHISASNPDCATSGFFYFGSYGIVTTGGVNSDISNNHIEKIKVSGPPSQNTPTAGIAVYDQTFSTPAVIASGNVVKGNILSSNDVDIILASTGTGNVFIQNDCTTSFPLGFCP